MGHLSGFFHGQRYLNVHQSTFSSLGLGRLRPLSSGHDAPGCSSTADGILVARGLFVRTTQLCYHVGRSIGFNLSHDGLKRHDDADLFFKVLSQGGSHTLMSRLSLGAQTKLDTTMCLEGMSGEQTLLFSGDWEGCVVSHHRHLPRPEPSQAQGRHKTCPTTARAIRHPPAMNLAL